jgi:hypothetical protein
VHHSAQLIFWYNEKCTNIYIIIPPLIEWGLYCNHLVRPSVHIFVTDISASTGRNDFIFDIWLWHGDLYRVSPFQVYRTSTSCLQCDLEFFMFAIMKTFVTVISASTGRNDFIFDIWLRHGDLYRVSPFQVYRTSTSCLQMNEWGYSSHDVACNILFLNTIDYTWICSE